VLDAKNFKDEFAHTILHKKDIFKELKAAKKKKDGKGILPEEDIEKLKSKSYNPDDGKGKGVDKATFDAVFSQYVDHVGNSRGKPSDARNPHESVAEKYGGTEPIAEEEDENLTDAQADEAAL
jgi:hypothetical protein